jgi:protein TonB
MGIKNNQSLWSSVILHGALIVALFLSTIIEAFLPKEKPHVFEMVSQPSPSNAAPSPAAPTEPPPSLDLLDVKPMDIADPVILNAAPAPPKPVVKPRPQPTPVKATPKPLISAADFFKQNPKKNPEPRKSQPTRPAYQAPTINTSKIQQNLQSNLPTTVHAPSGSLTALQRTALQRYGDQLNRRLNRAWIKPANLAGVGLVVTVVFDVSSSGRISNVRLRPASGNPSFDASVKAAFKLVGSGDVTPTRQGHSFTMSFKMVD